MAKSYYSIVLDNTASDVWEVIRPFDHYSWAGVPGETVIEGGRAGDQVGSVRRVDLGERAIRQKLLAHSDAERSYTYAFCEPIPFPVRNYVATIHVLPIIETNSAFVEWSATFDCAIDDLDHWINHFEREGFARWLAALRQFMAESRARI